MNLQNYVNQVSIFTSNITNYFLNPRIYNQINAFTQYSNNLIDYTNCSYIRGRLNNIDDDFSESSVKLYGVYGLGFINCCIIGVILVLGHYVDNILCFIYEKQKVLPNDSINNVFSV
jgi:hypothetical protein